MIIIDIVEKWNIDKLQSWLRKLRLMGWDDKVGNSSQNPNEMESVPDHLWGWKQFHETEIWEKTEGIL